MLTQQQLAMKKAQVMMNACLIIAILGANSLILLSPDTDDKNFYGNLLRPILAAVAAGLSSIVVYKQKTSGIFGRSFAALAIGSGLYLIAEIIWAYYSIGMGIEVPYPSLADGFWLAGYVPFGYGLFSLSKLYTKRGRNKRALLLMTLAVVIFSIYYIYQIISVSDLSAPNSGLALLIGIAYPILDAILIVPALAAVLSSGRGYLTATPWIFVSFILTAIADTIFGFTAVMSIAGDVSIWNLFYNGAYLSMAAGMFWHYRYMIFDPKRVSNKVTDNEKSLGR